MQISKNTFFIAALFTTLIGSGTALIGECGIDCEVDADCNAGLLCADDHSIDLRTKGYNPKKAYCTGIDGDYLKADVCYNPNLITQGPGAPPEPQGNIQACAAEDCDFDSNCAVGLLCADEHGPELAAKGLHPRKADCSNLPADYPDNFEVCFPASLIRGKGFGGMFLFALSFDGLYFVCQIFPA
jgi:hypothetical protein